MKKLLLAITLITATVAAFASGTLTKSDFQKSDAFKYTIVKSAELVFADELTEEEIYKVTYDVETHNCAPAAQMDFCEWVTICEYVIYDKASQTMEAPTHFCEKDLEDVIGNTGLIDEL